MSCNFFISIRWFSFTFCVFLYVTVYILNTARATTKELPANEIGDFIFENYYKIIGFSKENSYYSMKRLKIKYLLLLATKSIEKIPDPCNAKEHYQLFIRKKITNNKK